MEEREEIPPSIVGWRIWFTTWLIISIPATFFSFIENRSVFNITIFRFAFISFIAGIPAFVVLTAGIKSLICRVESHEAKVGAIYACLLAVSIVYGVLSSAENAAFTNKESFENFLIGFWVTTGLFSISVLAMLINYRLIKRFIGGSEEKGKRIG